MYSVKEVAKILNLSVRSIQVKCNKIGVPKVENEFQISEEILSSWKFMKADRNNKRNENQTQTNIPKKRVQKTTFNFAYLYVFLLVIIIFSFIIYSQYTLELSYKNQLKIQTNETNETKKILNENVTYLKNQIIKLENQNQNLKDSIKGIFGIKP